VRRFAVPSGAWFQPFDTAMGSRRIRRLTRSAWSSKTGALDLAGREARFRYVLRPPLAQRSERMEEKTLHPVTGSRRRAAQKANQG
jgi:hypothetical protein